MRVCALLAPLWVLEDQPSTRVGARIHPDRFSLPQAHHAFDEHGRIADAQLQARFDMTIADFIDVVEASKHYPRVKRAWVEYLGEHPEPAIDRVESRIGPEGSTAQQPRELGFG